MPTDITTRCCFTAILIPGPSQSNHGISCHGTFSSSSSSSPPHPSFSLPNSSSSGMVQKGDEVEEGAEMVAEAEIERLPVDLLAHIFSLLLSSFRDLAQASGVCRKWRRGVEQSLASRERLSFAGWKMDDASTTRLVCAAYNLKELDIFRSCWGCQITDEGLCKISLAKCVSNLTSISLWGMASITDKGVIQLVSRAISLQNLNIGGTFITDESLYAIANSCPQLKTINLWSCRHVTESGLIMLVNKCRKLESINVRGMRVPLDCFISLLTISPALQIKSISHHLNIGNLLPVS